MFTFIEQDARPGFHTQTPHAEEIHGLGAARFIVLDQQGSETDDDMDWAEGVHTR